MARKPTAAPATATAWENPLIPSRKLREIYTAMVELRLLEESIAKRRRGPRRKQVHGEEGCRASTILSLKPGDLTSEPAPGIATSFLRGAKLAELLNSAVPKAALAPGGDPETRLHLAIGASLSLASLKKGSLVAVYVYPGELSQREWKPILRLAAAHTAPIFIVVLPGPSPTPGQLSLTSTASGVPGIPVDDADPVALYRVAQESILRIRSGGGPVLMESIPFRIPGRPAEPADPILTMRQFMLSRGIVTDPWFEKIALRFARRLSGSIQ